MKKTNDKVSIYINITKSSRFLLTCHSLEKKSCFFTEKNALANSLHISHNSHIFHEIPFVMTYGMTHIIFLS